MKTGNAKAKTKGRTDWARISALTDDKVEAMAKADADNPASSAEDWANAVIGLPPVKRPVNANFDADVVAWFKSQGRGYQARMNAVLRKYMETHRKTG